MSTVLFNPYTGTPRHPSDIQSDPQGLLIVDPESNGLRAAAQGSGRYQFVCDNGCGVCGAKLEEFEHERTETLDGALISNKVVPKVVSTCCGSDVEVYDTLEDTHTDYTVEAVPGQPVAEFCNQCDGCGEIETGIGMFPCGVCHGSGLEP